MNSAALILIVDDQPSNLVILNQTLRNAGYQVASAKNGESAFKILDTLHPDLILCDIVMPDMDGFEICRKVKAEAKWSEIPFIFCIPTGVKPFITNLVV